MASLGILDLPREIRDRIFAFVYPVDKVWVYTLDWLPGRPPRFVIRKNGKSDFSVPNEVLAPLLVNHQFSAEAMAGFFGSHIFAATASYSLPFLRGIGDRRNLIRRVQILDDFRRVEQIDMLQEVLAILSTLPALQLVKIDYSNSVQLGLARARIDNYELEALDERVVVKVFCWGGHIKHVDFGADTKNLYDGTRIWTRVTGPERWKEERMDVLRPATTGKGP